MDCNDARQLLAFARPGVAELDGADLALLETHLAECAACGALYRNERRHDERLAAAMQAVPVIADGPARLMARLSAARWAWCRNRFLLLAAILIGAVMLGTVAYSYFGRPTLDPVTVAQSAYEQTGQGRTWEEARTIVDQWLRGIDRRLSAPVEWNYKLVAFLERSQFEGLSSVPTIVFTNGNATARVYVVRTSAFKNFDALEQPIEAGGCTVFVRRYAELPGWAFIVVTSGGPIEQFLRAVAPPQPA